jgi:hypothetical protein
VHVVLRVVAVTAKLNFVQHDQISSTKAKGADKILETCQQAPITDTGEERLEAKADLNLLERQSETVS